MATSTELVQEFQRIRPNLYQRMKMLVRNHHEIEEIIQQCFLRCWKYKKIEEIKHLENWIFRICYNCMKDYKNAKWEKRSILFSETKKHLFKYKLTFCQNESEQAELNEEREIIKESIDELTKNQRRFLLLNLEQKMSLRQIAKKYNIPIGTAKSRTNSAKQAIKRIINEKFKVKRNNDRNQHLRDNSSTLCSCTTN